MIKHGKRRVFWPKSNRLWVPTLLFVTGHGLFNAKLFVLGLKTREHASVEKNKQQTIPVELPAARELQKPCTR